MVKQKKIFKTRIQFNQGRDKKTGKIIRIIIPAIATADSKAEAIRGLKKLRDKKAKRFKGITKKFGIKVSQISGGKREVTRFLGKSSKLV